MLGIPEHETSGAWNMLFNGTDDQGSPKTLTKT